MPHALQGARGRGARWSFKSWCFHLFCHSRVNTTDDALETKWNYPHLCKSFFPSPQTFVQVLRFEISWGPRSLNSLLRMFFLVIKELDCHLQCLLILIIIILFFLYFALWHKDVLFLFLWKSNSQSHLGRIYQLLISAHYSRGKSKKSRKEWSVEIIQ